MLFREPTELYGTFFGSESIPEPGKKATVLPPYTVRSAQLLHMDTHLSRGSDIGFEILVETMTFVKNSDSVLTRSEVSHPKAWRKIVHQDTRGHAIPKVTPCHCQPGWHKGLCWDMDSSQSPPVWTLKHSWPYCHQLRLLAGLLCLHGTSCDGTGTLMFS